MSNNLKYIFVFLFIISVFRFEINAQFSHTHFDHLTINDGLSQSSIRVIYQDSLGFMWFGTHDGLNKYDGYNFTVFKKDIDDSTSISDNYIYDIDEDSENNLWIATAHGINKYERNTAHFEQVNLPEKFRQNINSNTIISIVADDRDERLFVWFATRDGVYRLDVSNNKFQYYDIFQNDKRLIDKKIFLHLDMNSDIYAVTNMDGVYKYEQYSNQFRYLDLRLDEENLNNAQLSPFYEDDQGIIWFGSIYGLTMFDPNNNKLISFKKIFEESLNQKLHTGFINSITEDNNGNLFLATGGYGLIKFNKITSEIEIFENEPLNPTSIELDVAQTLYKDRNGVIWIGTDGSGIDIYSPYLNNFNTFSQLHKSFSIKSIRTFFEDAKGTLWISGYDGLERYDPDSQKYKDYYTEFDGNTSKELNEIVYTIIEDYEKPDNYLYFGTEGSGVYRFNLVTEQFESFYFSDSSYGENLIFSLYDGGDGYLWIGTMLGLIRFDKSTRKVKRFFNDPADINSIGPQRVTDIFEDSNENFWIGTEQGGLNLMDRSSGTFERFLESENGTENGKISSNHIKCFYEDADSNLWIGTTNGLNKFIRPSRSFKKYDLSDGLPNNVIYGILEEATGMLWLSTNNGLSKFNPKNESFHNFNFNDGLQSNEFNTNAYYKTEKGQLLFGGISGFNSFYPENIIVNKNTSPIVFIDFKLFNESVAVNQIVNGRVLFEESISVIDTIDLEFSENIFSLTFAALNYGTGGKHLYRYRLVGFNDEFSNQSSDNSVTYTNLDPGEYFFEVVGSNGNGVWSESGTGIIIMINPPFYLTWWFFLGLLILIGTGLYSIYRYRMKRYADLENLRMKIASDLHDEVGSTLTKVSMRAEMLEMQTSNSRAATNLKRIADQSREAVSTMRDIVWSIDSRNDKISDLTNKIKDTAFNILSELGIQVDLQIEGLKHDDDIPLDYRQNIYLILREALTNIAKHSNANRVKIVLKSNRNDFYLIIHDNGNNFKEKENNSGQGLKNMIMRAEKINGKLSYKVENGFRILLEARSFN